MLLRSLGLYAAAAQLLLAHAASGQATYDRPFYPPTKPTPDLPVHYVDRLDVNTVNYHRNVARNKCEAQGVAEIYELLKSARFEEMWLFLPARGTEPCQWVEIGRVVVSGPDESTIKIDRTFLAKAMLMHDELHLYHFHPLAHFVRCKQPTGCDNLLLPNAAGQIPTESLVDNLRFAMPSAEDIYFMMDVSWEIDRRRNGRGRITNKVITPYGIVEYDLTAAGREKLRIERSAREGGLYIKLLAANALYEDNIVDVVNKTLGDVLAAVKKLARSMNSTFLSVIYTPVEELQLR
jgi:hypothetical protein